MKKRKKLIVLLLVGVFVISTITGCNSSNEKGSNGTVSPVDNDGGKDSNETENVDSGIIAFEDIEFPDAMPANPTLAEEKFYDYDDMNQHYELEFYTYNYGVEPPENDPIKAWIEKKYNVTITLTTSTMADMETILSTQFQSEDVPDLITLPTADPKGYGFVLGEQNLLLDAKEIYPYLPQTTKFVTKTLLDWSTMEDGTIPFITKYPLQDGDMWDLAIREDWLKNLDMKMPSTLEEIKEFARACTFDDPDGNGIDDTYFMTGAGGGVGLGMLGAFIPWFGNPSSHVVEGTLVSPMLDGSMKEYIEFLHELHEMQVFAPDWFTIDWETAKSYTLNDKIGMVNYPSQALYEETVNANNGDYTTAQCWTFLPSLPDGAKGNPSGNYGHCFAIPKSAVEGDLGKLKRICHILDAMCYGGEAYFATVQGGGSDVHEGYDADVREYLEDGTSYCYVDSSHPGYSTYGTDRLPLDVWQIFGYTLKWQKAYTDDQSTDEYKAYIDKINEGITNMASRDRWPNDALLITVPSDIAPNLNEFTQSQFYKFVVGERKMDEWEQFIQEYLDQGGLKVLKAEADSLGCELPEELQ